MMATISGGGSISGEKQFEDWVSYVEDLYQIFFDRSADPSAIASCTSKLQTGVMSPSELVRSLLASREFADHLPHFLQRHAVDQRRGLLNDCTQYGELQLLLQAWIKETAKTCYVVDVGARGRERSNSYDLLRHFGWRGLLVEANPALIAPIRRAFGGLDVEIANCAISNYNGRARLTLGTNDDVSSLEAWSAESWGETRGLIDVTVRRLPDLLSEYGAPRSIDLVSIDIEGEDVRVLNDFVADGRYQAEWVLIEASYDFSTSKLSDLPTSSEVQEMFRIVGQTRSNLLLRKVNR